MPTPNPALKRTRRQQPSLQLVVRQYRANRMHLCAARRLALALGINPRRKRARES